MNFLPSSTRFSKREFICPDPNPNIFPMPIIKPVTTLIFDWGDTIMRDYKLPGPMLEWDKTDYIPGARKVLEKLSKKYTCVIATSADHSGTMEMKAALTKIGAHKYFHYFFSSQELGVKKPDPEFFTSIIKILNIEPSECVMTGNMYDKDIVGAKAAGLQTVLFDEKKHDQDFPDADVVIHQMDELLNIL
jgi:HAD superfamily hydrolase (TIGR01549 family)